MKLLKSTMMLSLVFGLSACMHMGRGGCCGEMKEGCKVEEQKPKCSKCKTEQECKEKCKDGCKADCK